MSRLRWPDSTNSVSDDPGTVHRSVAADGGTLELFDLAPRPKDA